MTAELPPAPDGPPIPGVVYPPREAVAWIRTMTPEALVKASRRDPERFPSTKPGREVGFSGVDILAIIANTARTPTGKPVARKPRRRTPVADEPTRAPSSVTQLVARPDQALRRRAS